MKKKKFVTSIVLFTMVIILCAYAFSPAASAITTKSGSITLHIADSESGKALEGATFRLYFFAAAYEKGNGIGYEYVVPYDDCNMDMNNLQDSYLPIHLTHFAYTHNLPYTEKTSDETGYIVFENLTPGVYLITPEESVTNYYMPSPFVINIPLYNNENKNWTYDINATPKMQIYDYSDTVKTTYISVKKIWETQGTHPDSVTVSLLCDFKEVEKVTLNESNGWYHRWNHLSSKHSWSVVESKVPDGFKVSYEASSNTVRITNKATKTENTTTPSTKPDSKPPKEPETKPDELIDTGQLNWPIPVFSVSGLILFSIGWAMLNFGRKDEETV